MHTLIPPQEILHSTMILKLNCCILISLQQVLSLHSAQLQVDVTAPDFWVQVGAAMAERGYLRSPDACRDEWFKVKH